MIQQFGVVRFEVAFSGFATDTPWFLFGAICFGLMASTSPFNASTLAL